MSAPSVSCDAVLAASHPAPDEGGPCATCAFRVGTEANQSEHTMELARLCVEGLRPFYCHERPQLCRGYIAAANLRGVPANDDDEKWADVAGCAADILARCIEDAARAQQLRGSDVPAKETSGGRSLRFSTRLLPQPNTTTESNP